MSYAEFLVRDSLERVLFYPERENGFALCYCPGMRELALQAVVEHAMSHTPEGVTDFEIRQCNAYDYGRRVAIAWYRPARPINDGA